MVLSCWKSVVAMVLLSWTGQAIGQQEYSPEKFDYRIAISDTYFKTYPSSVEYGLREYKDCDLAVPQLGIDYLCSYEVVFQVGRTVRSIKAREPGKRSKYDATDWFKGESLKVNVGLLGVSLSREDLLLVEAPKGSPQKTLHHIFTKLGEQGKILGKHRMDVDRAHLAMVVVDVGRRGNEYVREQIEQSGFPVLGRLFFILWNRQAEPDLPEIITSQPANYAVAPLFLDKWVGHLKEGSNTSSQEQFEAVEPRIVECEYLMKDWVDIHGLSREEQRRAIAAKVSEYWVKLKTGKIEAIGAEGIQELNERWEQENTELNRIWFEKFLDREQSFQNSFRRYVEKVQEMNSIEIGIESAIRQVTGLKREIALAQQEIEEIEKSKRRIQERFRSQLANIPISVVAIGTMQVPTEDIGMEILRTATANRMIIEAVQDIVGTRVHTYTEVRNNDLVRSSIAETAQGNALVVDTYYMDSYKYHPEEHNTYLFQMHRIDVYPFDRNKPKFRAYPEEISEADRRRYEGEVEVGFDISRLEHLLSDAEENFWKSQSQIADKVNARVNAEIRGFRLVYEMQRNRLTERAAVLHKGIDELERELKTTNEILGRRREDLVAAKADSVALAGKYEADKESYKRFYAYRDSYVNRPAYWAAPPSNRTEREYLREMVRNTFSVTSELGHIEVLVLVEAHGSEYDAARMRLRSEIVSYEPKVEAFKILYLTLLMPVRGGNASFLLNIAYRVRWQPQRRQSQGCLDLSKADEGILVLHEDGRRYEWRLIGHGYTTPYDAIKIGDEEWVPHGWRLPTARELSNLFRCIQEEDEDGRIFAQYGWPGEAPYLSSEEAGHKYLAYSFASQIPDTLELGDDVYSLRVKVYSEE